MSQKKLKIVVFSDYICPFCYIGFFRVEQLKANFDIDVEWRPFEIHPETPKEGTELTNLPFPKEYLEMMKENIQKLADDVGVSLNLNDKLPNSRLALYFSEFARKKGKFDAFHKLVFDAYWKDGRDIGDQDLLLSIAESIGFKRSEILEYIDSEEPFEELKKSLKELRKYGVNGVPTFIIGDRIVVGAQPYEVFEKVIRKVLETDLVL
ncbi:MAG: DsbA family oxidoreductase [Candidatus Lokiarchaeota archaeon]|nr:DsbA family oxidoreductase [Candidatus Lokiarchaeota archaeon]